MIRTIGAAIGALIIVFFMADIATRLGASSADTTASPSSALTSQR